MAAKRKLNFMTEHQEPLMKMPSPKSNSVFEEFDALVAFHVTTSGDQDEDAGCDEAPIVLISAKLIHLNKAVVGNCEMQILVHPGDQELSAECMDAVSLTERELLCQISLPKALHQLNSWLKENGLTCEKTGRANFCLVTDGPVCLRLVLHPNMVKFGLNDFRLYPYLLSYIDLREAVKAQLNLDSPVRGIVHICEILNMELPYLPMSLFERVNCLLSDETASELKKNIEKRNSELLDGGEQMLGLWPREHCRDLARIVLHLIRVVGPGGGDRGNLSTGSYVSAKKYEIVSEYSRRTEQVDDTCVVRARGLPWQTTDQEIHQFFRGITIAPGGIALVLGKNGRRNGEALIKFKNSAQKDLALRRHKHHMGNRYIEVYSALAQEFLDAASADTEDGEKFISKIKSGEQCLVRIRGLPYDANETDIIRFFDKINVAVEGGQEGVMLVKRKDGKATGDAFVIFANSEDAERALTNHRQHIGSRYVELFKSTPAEVNQVMNGVHNTQQQTVNLSSIFQPNVDYSYSQLGDVKLPLLNCNLPESTVNFVPPAPLLQELLPVSTSNPLVKISGMPLSATTDELLNFLGYFCSFVMPQGIHLVKDSSGNLPTGEAVIELSSDLAAQLLVDTKNFTFMQTQHGEISQVQVLAYPADACDKVVPLVMDQVAQNMILTPNNSFIGLPNNHCPSIAANYFNLLELNSLYYTGSQPSNSF
ncbi:Epithelial splicing regulatory protein 2 [Cichlidogyrus casuarinus]|uniref:Epithelial splicing regulatory protein 2 n=1 Tax=Cichlidogyrus casuarinus TaxID=1844966 RepID=A0ABD2Q804_9PLAT